MIRRLFLIVVLAASSLHAGTTVTILHFSDYHSHAVPFYTGSGERGGIARAIGYLERHKRAGALVFNGGDMLNLGAPAWSDKYMCVEWPWLNGIVDAMAFGNHDADYGDAELLRCRQQVRYPVLSANTSGFERSLYFDRNGVRIGVFAIAGPDFPALVTHAKLAFSDPVATARDVVQTLRQRDHVDAVVMIGHEHAEDDYRLAAVVPGIDLILGTHSHTRRELTKIAGTNTWFISPGQYLEAISKVELTFAGHNLTGVNGELVPVDAKMSPDAQIAKRVAAMETRLESDPQYATLFRPIAKLPKAMSVEDLASFTVDTMREVAKADVAMSTKSSFRQPLPPGTVTFEALRAALPYDNEIVVAELDAAEVKKFADVFVSGAPSGSTVKIAVTDYMANIASKDVFAGAKVTRTGIKVRDAVMRRLGSSWPSAP